MHLVAYSERLFSTHIKFILAINTVEFPLEILAQISCDFDLNLLKFIQLRSLYFQLIDSFQVSISNNIHWIKDTLTFTAFSIIALQLDL